MERLKNGLMLITSKSFYFIKGFSDFDRRSYTFSCIFKSLDEAKRELKLMSKKMKMHKLWIETVTVGPDGVRYE